MQREAGLCEKYSTTGNKISQKLKLSQESLGDEVSLFQQLLKFFSFYQFLCMGWGCFEYKIIGNCLVMIIMLVVEKV